MNKKIFNMTFFLDSSLWLFSIGFDNFVLFGFLLINSDLNIEHLCVFQELFWDKLTQIVIYTQLPSQIKCPRAKLWQLILSVTINGYLKQRMPKWSRWWILFHSRYFGVSRFTESVPYKRETDYYYSSGARAEPHFGEHFVTHRAENVYWWSQNCWSVRPSVRTYLHARWARDLKSYTSINDAEIFSVSWRVTCCRNLYDQIFFMSIRWSRHLILT